MNRAAIKLAAALVALPGWAWAQPGREVPSCWYYPHMMGGGWFAMIFGPILMLAALAALIAAVFFVAHRSGAWPGIRPDRTPIDILKERFARGEIDKAEFEDRRRVLGD